MTADAAAAASRASERLIGPRLRPACEERVSDGAGRACGRGYPLPPASMHGRRLPGRSPG